MCVCVSLLGGGFHKTQKIGRHVQGEFYSDDIVKR